MNNTPVTADVYSLVVKHHFLNLVYLRVANDVGGNSAWETIRTTLKVADPVQLERGKVPSQGGVLNGRALRLPLPSYPAQARDRHIGGTVVVQVLIDELGDVIAVCAVSGDSALQNAAVAAARQAKFTSTKLSGKPVRVTGVIVYNFVPR
jgi:TonB family protein